MSLSLMLGGLVLFEFIVICIFARMCGGYSKKIKELKDINIEFANQVVTLTSQLKEIQKPISAQEVYDEFRKENEEKKDA